jgi:hypothetical protein
MTDITKEDIGNALVSFAKRVDYELFSCTEEEVSERWYWSWDENKSVEWNTYQFFDMLHLHRSQCRRWEEHHNGSCCVVERVRDKYLMPRIEQFLECLQS